MRPVEEKTFRTHDGVELFYRYWPAEEQARRGAIVMFHRGHEHSGRMGHLPDELNLPGFAVFAWDARGHGRSPGERGFSPSLATSVRDVQSFIDHIVDTYGIAVADMAVMAQSVGAVLAATWAHDYAPGIRCLVLASPAFKVKLYVPFARTLLKLRYRLQGHFFVNSYVKPRVLTHDPERVASYKADPLITRPIAVNILLALYEAADRVVADARAITIPTQLLISGADWVVHHGPQHRFYERLGTPIKERHVLPGFFHDTLGEKDRAIAVGLARSFILARFAEPPSRPSLVDADRFGYTRDEADALASPLPPLSPRGLYWAATRLVLKLGGPLSAGIALGHRTGFDTGSTLDYVYRNTPEGLGPVGWLVDKSYLASIGWRGIRQRKLHVEELLRSAMQRLRDKGMPVHVMDIAAGHGRYVLEALDGSPVRPDEILLRDYSDLNVAAGSKLIEEKQLGAIARFERGDAFDGESLAGVRPKPTLGIVSGLYELFPDNRMLRESLAGLAAAIAPGGYLVYTGQPWHPQLELIARAHQPSPGAGLDHAPPHPGRDGSARRCRRVPQARAAHRRVGHLHRLARRDDGGLTMAAASAAGTTAPLRAGRPWRRAACWLAALGPFFLLSYGGANWLAALRDDVPSIVFGWEHRIPFLGWTIIPYWSIDALYGLSLFLCASEAELDTHGRRLLTAQIVTVACFILFPLRFAFARPEVAGVSGFLFAALTSFDKPFNQAPSLHIALLTVLWPLYARHVPRWALGPLHLWFALIGVSVLTTYQHHFIDVPTGALVGLLCLWLWPDGGASPLSCAAPAADRRRWRLAAYYAAGSAALAACAFAIVGAGLWLLWPATSLALVAANYAFIGAAGFQKDADGRMSVAARWLLAPYLLGAWINSRLWTRRNPAPSLIRDGVWLGRLPSRREAAPFATIFDLCAELPGPCGPAACHAVPLLDLVAPAPERLREIAAGIERSRAAGPVLVCCALGYSRSAAAIAAWLLSSARAATPAAAVEQIRRARPRIVIGVDTLAAIAAAGQGR